MFDFEGTQGDGGKVISATLIGADGDPVVLTNATVVIVVSKDCSTPIVSTAATVNPDQITNPGVVTYTLTVADMAASGDYEMVFIATWLDGTTLTFPTVPLTLRIRRALAA